MAQKYMETPNFDSKQKMQQKNTHLDALLQHGTSLGHNCCRFVRLSDEICGQRFICGHGGTPSAITHGSPFQQLQHKHKGAVHAMISPLV